MSVTLYIIFTLISAAHIVGAARNIPQSSSGVLRGTLKALTGQDLTSRLHQEVYLQTSDSQHWALDYPESTTFNMDHLGAMVEVQYSHSKGQRLILDRHPQLVNPSHRRRRLHQHSVSKGMKGNVKMIIFIMDLNPLCGKSGPAASPQDLMDFLGKKQPMNLAGMYETCSMGNARLDVAGSLAITVPFPCNGTLANGTPFVTSTCTNQVLLWQKYAEEQVINMGILLDEFQHRVMILPPNFHGVISDCNFEALSSQGQWDTPNTPGNPWGYGYVWISGDAWNWIPFYWHELGHNYGLEHARSEVQPFIGNTKDFSCAMGSWTLNKARCHNAPHLWAMGWSSPAGMIDLSGIGSNYPAQIVSVPVQLNGPTGLHITVTLESLFSLSFRTMSSMYDRPFIDVPLEQALVIHRVPSNVSNTDTSLVGVISSTLGTWTDPQTLFSIHLISWDESSATVAVCKRITMDLPCYQNSADLADISLQHKATPVYHGDSSSHIPPVYPPQAHKIL